MPGVPSGRACQGCRQQRKKCDEARPACARCTRLGVECIGAGERRYLFKQEAGFRDSNQIQRQAESSSPSDTSVEIISRAPSNNLTLLAASLISATHVSIGMRYSLAWNCGGFLLDVPQHLGLNEALDSSVEALVSLHLSVCSSRRVHSKALLKYSRALGKLRVCLDDPLKATSTETLCAVMILLICQGFIGTGGQFWTGHCEGATEIMKARRFHRPHDDFEKKLLLSLRGPVVLEGIFNDKIKFTPKQWEALSDNKYDDGSCEGRMMHYLARIPGFMLRGRKIIRGQEDLEFMSDITSTYQGYKDLLKEMHDRLVNIEIYITEAASELDPFVQARDHFERSYAFALSVAIILNRVLGVFESDNTTLTSESANLSKEILSYSGPSHRFRPLGSQYMLLCLVAAWMGATDNDTRLAVERELEDYYMNSPTEQAVSPKALKRTYRILHFIGDDHCD